ncbi:MAG: hypothetical protein H7Z11_08470 [Verrucomicrobia bacterium]|nr:hypothetical protein [Leptolyngbya sp. ES-bin-22]
MNDEGGNSTTQHLLTVLVQATAELTQSNQQQKQAIEQGYKQQNQKIDLLTDQIGHLTEVVTTGFAELKESVRQQSELAQQQSETAKRQEQNITRLVGIVEALVQPRP